MITGREKMNVPKLRSQFRPINEMLFNSNSAEILRVAIDAGIFEVLSGKELTSSELALEMQTVPEITEALIETLVGMELLKKHEKLYSLTVEAEEFLVSDSPSSQLNFIMNSRQYHQLICNLPSVLKNGIDDQNLYSDEMWADENKMMMMGQSVLGGQLQDCFNFICELSGFYSMKKMCDPAGNHGFYTMALVDENPQMKGVICDLPATVVTAEKIIREKKYEDRINTLAADIYSEPIGENYDLVFCSHILYKWGKAGELAAILEKVNRSLNTGGVFVSNHITLTMGEKYSVSALIMELLTKMGGYPSHSLSWEVLEDALGKSGFEVVKVKPATESCYYNTLLLAARKVREL